MSNKYQILIVEDEENIAIGLAFNLKQEGYEVLLASDGEQALTLWKEFKPSLIILDLMLPKLDGIEVLSIIRQTDEIIPILILTAKDQIEDKIQGLKMGCDDYLSKPFNLDELMARIKRLIKYTDFFKLRRPSQNSTYKFGQNRIHLNTYWVETGSKSFRLTEQEMKLIQVFINNPNTVISKKQLLKEGWGYSDHTETRTLDIFIARLRKYFEKDSKNPMYFISLRNKGLIFSPGQDLEKDPE